MYQKKLLGELGQNPNSANNNYDSMYKLRTMSNARGKLSVPPMYNNHLPMEPIYYPLEMPLAGEPIALPNIEIGGSMRKKSRGGLDIESLIPLLAMLRKRRPQPAYAPPPQPQIIYPPAEEPIRGRKKLGGENKIIDQNKNAIIPETTEERKALTNKVKDKANYEAWKKYMPRLVVVKFLVALGFTDDLRSEINDANNPNQKRKVEKPSFETVELNGNQSLANDAYWADYVKSLSGVPAIKKAESSLLTAVANSAADALKGITDLDNIMGFKENFTWSEGKKGGILFGYKGNTYELQGQQIGEVETIEPKIKSISENSGDIDEWDKKRLVEFMAKLREVLGNI